MVGAKLRLIKIASRHSGNQNVSAYIYSIQMITAMKKLISLLTCLLILAGCTNRDATDRIATYDPYQKADTSEYPILIDGGTKIVYQFGRMTADKGLKLYYDTIPNTARKAPPDKLFENPK
jgi:hypothetical protein